MKLSDDMRLRDNGSICESMWVADVATAERFGRLRDMPHHLNMGISVLVDR
jgi:hypothetical protein